MKLVIVGSGPILAELEARAGALGIRPDTIFEPATSEVPAWLHAMDIFVLPSLSEAFSNALMEAMACGCCVVASNAGGNPELVQDGETGLLFERANAASLANVLQTLIENRELRLRLAANGMRFVTERFPVQAAAQRMGEIYSDLLIGRQQMPASRSQEPQTTGSRQL